MFHIVYTRLPKSQSKVYKMNNRYNALYLLEHLFLDDIAPKISDVLIFYQINIIKDVVRQSHTPTLSGFSQDIRHHTSSSTLSLIEWDELSARI